MNTCNDCGAEFMYPVKSDLFEELKNDPQGRIWDVCPECGSWDFNYSKENDEPDWPAGSIQGYYPY